MVNCIEEKNRLDCGSLCVSSSWFSKITKGFVNAEKVCLEQGYNGNILEYGSNSGRQCKYPGGSYGKPDFTGGLLHNFGENVAWKCKKYGRYNKVI